MQGQYVQGPPPGYGGPQYGGAPQYGGQPQQAYYAPQQPVYAMPISSQPPPVMVYQQQQPTEIVVIETPQMSVGYGAGFSRDSPTVCVCPNCRGQVQTRLSMEPGGQAWCCMCILLIFFWPLFWLPLCMPACMDVTHSCPQCGAVITRITSQ